MWEALGLGPLGPCVNPLLGSSRCMLHILVQLSNNSQLALNTWTLRPSNTEASTGHGGQ